MDNKMGLLVGGAAQLGIHLTDGQLAQFDVYRGELADWNRRVNLTSITDCAEVQTKHFLDSLTVCLAVGTSFPPGYAVADVGSGAGLPGLPLKLAFPGMTLHLIESVGKKTAFLRHMVKTLGLEGVAVHTGRAEELARDPDLRDSCDLALVRGVARLPLLLEYALPFCRPGAYAVALKHGPAEPELLAAEHALAELGSRHAGTYPVTLERLTDNRVVLCFEKTGPTPERYPRRTGIPAKRPL
jgi:16S rRNA (guanine527-N7)-methyltransferase